MSRAMLTVRRAFWCGVAVLGLLASPLPALRAQPAKAPPAAKKDASALPTGVDSPSPIAWTGASDFATAQNTL